MGIRGRTPAYYYGGGNEGTWWKKMTHYGFVQRANPLKDQTKTITDIFREQRLGQVF